ncbi:BQ5605_C011g06352 [Microbotryum silenes-dioicae]|uniref:BQ5605_C011g06352 protein n=1 Tax=Microbotryum silenes-dioicae TaxID=796604 RepID=A0A2X0LT29_9BASI|nr:BQ5605_C011g06352 [Microbotryum silenes-dioicae]
MRCRGRCEDRGLTSGEDGVVQPTCCFQKKSERHEIALEPHWFRVQTERIKRCNSQAKKDYSKD